MITVFTPTYNRAYIIRKLYKALCGQINKNFEWLVVDDGSTDNTEFLIKDFVAENKIKIKYIRQQNGGKHIAINTGVAAASGDLFFIVDSDDYLTPDAIEWMDSEWNRIKNNKHFAGISGIRIYSNGTKIGGGIDFGTIDADPLSIRYTHHIKGDLAEAWRTEIMKVYPFPVFSDERFCSEGLIWGRIAQKYIVRFVHKGIYVCGYLDDGLTKNSIQCRRNSPEYSALAYSEFMNYPQIPIKYKFAYAINFWRFSVKGKKSFFARWKQGGFWSVLAWLPGKLFALKDLNPIVNKTKD